MDQPRLQPRPLKRLEARHEKLDGVLNTTQQLMQQVAQLQAQTAQLMQAVMQTNQQITQALQEIVKTNQQVARALMAPRRRVPVRDAEGRITEAHDLPMNQ